jgi:dCMP deaminase
MSIARIISGSSYAKRKKVGCILVKENNIIAIGYNGTPSGFDNSCEINNITKKEVLHAESNAIAKCAMSSNSSKDAILYTTLSPCIDCAKLIIQCGIKAVYFEEYYTSFEGLNLLKKANIYYEHI